MDSSEQESNKEQENNLQNQSSQESNNEDEKSEAGKMSNEKSNNSDGIVKVPESLAGIVDELPEKTVRRIGEQVKKYEKKLLKRYREGDNKSLSREKRKKLWEILIRKEISDKEWFDHLDSDQRLKIQAELEEYEQTLRKQYRRDADRHLITSKTKAFKERLIEREWLDELRDIDDIRSEEHFAIGTNLILTLVLLAFFMAWAMLVSDSLESIATNIVGAVTRNFNWFYILASSGFLIYLFYLAFSRFGNVVLGDPGEKPEFSDVSWYAMLFSAGMGVGMLFWGGAEPIQHFISPPVADPRSVEAARMAMVYSAFHWGLHAWGIYTVCAVGVAYYGFRKRKKYLISSSVMDVFEQPKINRVLKIFSDLVATLAIVFGVAASLGLGILQISAGLDQVFGLNATSNLGRIIIITLMTILFILSASTGLKKGIKFLSNLNMLVAILLLVFIFLVGPKLFILKIFVDTIGQYLTSLFELSFKIAPFTPAYEKWMGDWTLTYFTWWIAWAPFVGIFIARISKGRTIKQLIMGALIVPTVFCILWFSVFGGTALHLEIYTDQGIGHMVQQDVDASLFMLLEQYPLYKLTASVAIFLLFTFLITSADSATFVISMMTTEGDLDPKFTMKILWGVIMAVLTILLVLGGGIKALQAAALLSAFPFSIVLILITISLHVRLSMQVKSERI